MGMWFLFVCWLFAYFLDIFVIGSVMEFSVEKENYCSIEQAFKESYNGSVMVCGKFVIKRINNTLIITKKQ